MPDPTPSAQFAEFLNALLESQGLSGAQAARRLHVAQSQVSRWRRGEGGVSLENLTRIHEEFGIDLGTLRRLAGYGDSTSSTMKEGIDPEVEAIFDAERAETHEALRGIPKTFWPTILTAWRDARRMTVNNIAAALELAQSQTINTPEGQPINTSKEHTAELNDDDTKRGPGGLTRSLALVGAR